MWCIIVLRAGVSVDCAEQHAFAEQAAPFRRLPEQAPAAKFAEALDFRPSQ
ncbi:MAG: hypothetical protein KDA41_05410 [Planctomycetales bacterium]|nr:hypothetical protein [Planctomycetales bacterium]